MALDDIIGRPAEGPPWVPELLACDACPARQDARRPVPPYGPLSAGIMVLGPNPDEDEDRTGRPFSGPSGTELDVWLQILGLDRDKLLVTHAVKCHTSRNRPPKPIEVATCKVTWLQTELQTYRQVRVVATLGRPALAAVLGPLREVPGILTPWHIWVAFEPDNDRRLLVIPLPHPGYVLRVPGHRAEVEQRLLPAVRGYLRQLAPDVYAASQGAS